MQRIKVMIAEDERLAREELAYMLGKEPDFELLPSAGNGRELLELVPALQPHVVFLDIQMPELKGIPTAHILKSMETPPLIVFTTAHEDYAVEAFSLNAVDYLLKPYSSLRLQETLSRIRAKIKEQADASFADEPKKSAAPALSKWNKLLIEDGDKHVLIDPTTIVYAVREEKTVEIYTKAEQRFVTKLTLQELEERLGMHSFFRPHRSYLVNLDLIDELVPWFNGAYNLVLKDAKRTQIPMSRSAAKELFKRLEGQ